MSNTKQSAFTKRMIQNAGTIKQARKTKANDYEIRLPEGTYVANLAEVKFGISKNDSPYVGFQFVVTHPRETANGVKVGGKQANVTHFLSGSDWSTEDEAYERFFQDAQRLGEETENLEPADIEEVVSSLAEKDLSVRIEIAKSKKGRKFARIKGLATAEDEETASVEPKSQSERTAADAMDEAILNEKDENPPFDPNTNLDDWEPQEGDVYEYRTSNRGRYSQWTTLEVDYDNHTLTLRRDTDGKEATIPWDDSNLGSLMN